MLMSKRTASDVTASDFFCGAGGSSTGMAQIDGLRIIHASNHWNLAVAVHNQNHPDTDHSSVDLHQEDPAFFPTTDVAWFSPECTKWSQANGSAPLPAIEEGLFEDPLSAEAATRSRLLMFDVLRFAEHHHYRYMVVENVVDIATQSKYRLAWYEWRKQLSSLGYRFRVISLNSMHASTYGQPAPQSRDRIYIVCWREGERAPELDRILRPKAYCPKCGEVVGAVQSWKNGKKVGRYRQTYLYVHSQCGTVVEPDWLPASAAIDWSIPGERIGDRLKPKTRARIAAGIARYWSPLTLEAAGNTYDAADPSHPNHGDPEAYYRAWPVEQAMRALHTSNSKGLAVPVEGRDGKETLPLDVPMRTQTTRAETALAHQPFITEMYGTSTARSVAQPAGTFTAGGNHHGLVTDREPFVMTNNHNNRERLTSESAPTLTTATGGGSGLVTPAGGSWNDDARSTDEALRTLHTREAYALVTPYYGTACEGRPVSEPVGALTTRDRYALVTRHYGTRGGDPARHTTPAHEYMRTLTANGGNMSLSTAPDPDALVHRHNAGGAEMTTPVFEELRTLTTGGHQSLLQQPRPRVTAEDMAVAMEMVPEVLFRMFRPHEVAAGMAFPRTYRWDVLNDRGRTPSNRDLVKMAGNAVTPPASRDIMAVVVEAMTGERVSFSLAA